MSTKVLSVLAVCAVAGAAVASGQSADAPGQPDCKPNTTFENDEVRIWFHAMTGFIRIVDKNASSGQGMYFFKSRDVTELDGDGNALRVMNLNRAFPGSSTCEIVEDEETIRMNLTVTDKVRSVNGRPVGDATVTLSYAFNKTAYGAKFDVIVTEWPWARDAVDHELAYDFRVRAGNLALEPAENGVGVQDANGESQGYVEWAANATATYADGSQREANATASWTGNESALDVRIRFHDVDGEYVKLYYDPWMGIGDYVIVLNRLVGFAPLEQALPAGAGRAVRALL